MFPYFLSLILALAVFAGPLTAQSTIIGALEDVPPLDSRSQHHRAVRVLFEKKGNEWQAFPDCPDVQCLSAVTTKYPHEVVWTVSFDGKNLGKITGTTPKKFNYYADIGLQEISSEVPIPVIGTRSRAFGGYTGAAIYRPLVTNSKPFVSDPDLWKRSNLPAGLSLRLRQEFRRHYGQLCRLGEDSASLKPLAYRNENIRIIQAYTSKTKWAIARLHLGGAIDCHDIEAGFEIDDGWFVIDPQRNFRYLDDGLWLVDAGDYDNDGHSELVFAINRDNRGGYEVFYDDFKKRAIFEYSYH